MPRFLADTSALARSQTRPEVREALDVLLRRNEVAVCAIVELEVLYSATSPDHYRSTADALGGLPRIDIDEGTMRRALEVQATLAARFEHRSVTLPDLLIAACAERAGLTVLHYDADFDRISGLTGQATRWVVPRGSAS